MTKLKTMLFAGALLPMAAIAQEGFDYTYVEVNYLDTDVDNAGDDSGFGLKGSLELTDTVYLIGEYQTYDDSDLDLWAIGGGLRWNLKPELDVLADLSWVEADAGPFDDDGLQLNVGLRARVHDQIEVQGGIRHLDLDDTGSGTCLTLGGRYYFTRNAAVGLGLDLGDDTTTWRIGLRGEFGSR